MDVHGLRLSGCLTASQFFRDLTNEDEVRFGVTDFIFYAKNRPPVDGAQWTGIVTQIAMEMLQSGTVEAVVCVQSDEHDRYAPKPVVAFTVEELLKSKGVKPTLSPNLNVLATVEALQVKRLLFIGVGCQVESLDKKDPSVCCLSGSGFAVD